MDAINDDHYLGKLPIVTSQTANLTSPTGKVESESNDTRIFYKKLRICASTESSGIYMQFSAPNTQIRQIFIQIHIKHSMQSNFSLKLRL